uniref:Fibroblast growth factor 1b n=1 Tax=Cyprinus carpio TaxID=7962 RepID=A0A0C6EHM3_CYPCA|nr:fibroblast growth factor 1b [Cyprinus carpio]
MTERDITAFTLLPTTTEQKEPKHNSLQKLYCRNGGYHLRIQPNGTVDASRQDNDVYTLLKVMLNDECCFIEKIEENNYYNTYHSQRYQENGDWYVGIKKNGRTKNSSKTHKGQNAIYFLPIPVDGSIQ